MARSASTRPLRTLGVLAACIAALFGLIGAGVVWSDAQWTPKLALDLEGGTQIVLRPVPVAGEGAVTPEKLQQAVDIIRQRVNGSGVSEAEVSTSGENVVVSLPGTQSPETVALVKQSAQLQFRAVLVAEGTAPPPAPSPTGSPSPSASGSPSASPSGSRPAATARPGGSPAATATRSPSAAPSATQSTNGAAVPKALLQEQARVASTPSPTGSPTGSAQGSPRGTASPGTSAGPRPSGSPAASPQPSPTDASDTNWIDERTAQQFQALDCTNAQVRQDLRGAPTDPARPLVTCEDDGSAKYILGPAEVVGTDVTDAVAGLERNAQGLTTGNNWQVDLTFSGEGGAKFARVTERLASLQGVRNQFAIVLDNQVISAPTTNEPIRGGQAQITGGFTQESSQSLAQQLKYGALPVTFETQTQQQISATLGTEQLQRGLLAGLIGMLLVVLYSLLQYRALGLVTVASLLIAGLVTYGLVVLLGWRQGYRLSLPGVAGLIVSIGITADSFIVYFERIRDEVRAGRSLPAAVEAGWARARRTILISDVVNVLAAVVLYVLAVGGVRGFAFTLGLTTLVDVLIVFLFTKPLVTLLARSRFFAAGSRWSGFDAEHLNRGPAYVGRGRLRSGAPATASGQEPGTGEESGTADGSRAATSAESSPQPSTEPSSEPSSEPSTQQRTEDEELVPAGAPAPRRGGRGGGTPADGADAIGFGPRGATPPRRTGSSIAERRAAAERAAREAREASPTDGSAASGANGKDL